MRVSTAFKRAFLRRQYSLSVAASTTLLVQLEATLDARVDLVATGQAIASTSGNGHSTSFSEPGKGGPGPDSIAELCEELIRRHTLAVATLGGSPTQLQIRDGMLAQLITTRESTNSFSNLRNP